jgi:hypothetical protein
MRTGFSRWTSQSGQVAFNHHTSIRIRFTATLVQPENCAERIPFRHAAELTLVGWALLSLTMCQ